ncbi:hypothetical protein O6H91_08G090300 [Diphasiastrum complanatum]|uniref:Uncharacterized protein n=2 Tax=Diphasiastrum complanatum TaxID=34168 RepID=A0ACC2C8R2_DIPCM|nr:hypothetical protein O6H91_11G040700 [Diphasiastrum complanatum]KAJ7547538.1 hypothetical protein O6H91_08G090300 [Diphasiastrum complanatum]
MILYGSCSNLMLQNVKLCSTRNATSEDSSSLHDEMLWESSSPRILVRCFHNVCSSGQEKHMDDIGKMNELAEFVYKIKAYFANCNLFRYLNCTSFAALIDI